MQWMAVAVAFGSIAWLAPQFAFGGKSADAGSSDDAEANAGSAAHRSKSAKASDRAEAPHAEMERSPADVQQRPIPFSGDLEPIGENRAKKMLGAICPDDPVRLKVDGQKMWACRRCPGFTTRAEQDGPLVLDRTIRGDFVDEGTRDAFVTYRGCEAARTAHGGGIVFRKRRGEWEAHYRHPGLNPQACLVFRSDEHTDRLICRVRFENDGKVIQKIVDATGGDGTTTLVRTLDNSAACPKKVFISSYLNGWERKDLNGDGRRDLRVEKIQRQTPLGKKNDKPVCNLADAGGRWKRARRLEFVYHFDGRRLNKATSNATNLAKAVGTSQLDAVQKAAEVQQRAIDRARFDVRGELRRKLQQQLQRNREPSRGASQPVDAGTTDESD